MFKEIEKKYSGWLETEEETPLRNQLRWTRLRVEGPPDFMRSLIEVELEDLQDTYMGERAAIDCRKMARRNCSAANNVTFRWYDLSLRSSREDETPLGNGVLWWDRLITYS
uniref:Putative ovule protein n=1 Tax=Solanum chacoense TaxID=4108 RepID=A0A0V0I4G4_SOLCH